MRESKQLSTGRRRTPRPRREPSARIHRRFTRRGRFVEDLRIKLDITQEEFAEQAGLTSADTELLSVKDLYRLERGHTLKGNKVAAAAHVLAAILNREVRGELIHDVLLVIDDLPLERILAEYSSLPLLVEAALRAAYAGE
jgi:transcriptional regulator with XRE-family HTH domain